MVLLLSALHPLYPHNLCDSTLLFRIRHEGPIGPPTNCRRINGATANYYRGHPHIDRRDDPPSGTTVPTYLPQYRYDLADFFEF